MKQALETRAEERPDPGSARTHQRIARWWQSAPTFFSMLALFISLAVFANERMAEGNRVRLEYIRIAVAILNPAQPTEPQRELRSWAVEVLSKSAEVKLSDEQKQDLINGTSAFPYGTDYGYGRDRGNYAGYGIDGLYAPAAPQPSATAKPNP